MKKNKRAFSSNTTVSFIKPNSSLDKLETPRIKIKVTGSKLIHSIYGNYTEYHITVFTDFEKWIVKKRYSEFDALNNVLISKIPQINKLFPPKRIFKNSEDITQERIENFNQYFKFILKNYNIFEFPEICDFIEMDKNIVELFIQRQKMLKREGSSMYQSLKKFLNRISLMEKLNRSMSEITDNEELSSLNNKINSEDKIPKENLIERTNTVQINNYIIENNDDTYDLEESNSNYFSALLEYENSKQEYKNENTDNNSINIINDINNFNTNKNVTIFGNLVIEEFLRNLSQKYKNKTEIINSFQNFLKSSDNWPHFDEINIKKLFVGINDNKNCLYEGLEEGEEDERKLPGLFELIGNYENNILLSFGCLDLLVKLIDNEYNPEIELYLEVFRNRDIKEYESMKLEEIIKNNIGGETMTKNALKVLHVLFNDNNLDDLKAILIKDKFVIKRLNNFNLFD